MKSTSGCISAAESIENTWSLKCKSQYDKTLTAYSPSQWGFSGGTKFYPTSQEAIQTACPYVDDPIDSCKTIPTCSSVVPGTYTNNWNINCGNGHKKPLVYYPDSNEWRVTGLDNTGHYLSNSKSAILDVCPLERDPVETCKTISTCSSAVPSSYDYWRLTCKDTSQKSLEYVTESPNKWRVNGSYVYYNLNSAISGACPTTP
jgi:hypothetical protein